MSASSNTAGAVPQGRVARTLLRWLMRPAKVTAVETLSPRFRLVDLQGEALRDVAWSPGQKVQVAIGDGLSARTYTPLSWDLQQGATRMLTFAHGDAPGARWSTGLRVGDTCQFFGPRRSTDIAGLAPPLVLFGDETSFGLGASLRSAPQGRGAAYVFEVWDVAESRPVLEAMGLGEATVIARAADGAHLPAVADELTRQAVTGAKFVLTGSAPSIQHVSRALKTAGVGAARLSAKAYWAPGKSGLD